MSEDYDSLYFEQRARQSGVRNLVHQLLNGYGAQRSGELSGPWLVAALRVLGHEPPAVRQMLRRMRSTRELEVRREGRTNHFRLSEFSRSGAETGARKLFGTAPEAWDGRWTLALYQFGARERDVREHVRVILSLEGFGSLSRGVFLHPRDRVKAVTRALASLDLSDRLRLFRASRAAGPDDPRTAAAAWDLDALAGGYAAFLGRFEPLAQADLAPRDAFVASAAAVAAFLDVAFADPELPAALLPGSWPGARARRRVAAVLARLQPGMLAFGDSLLDARP